MLLFEKLILKRTQREKPQSPNNERIRIFITTGSQGPCHGSATPAQSSSRLRTIPAPRQATDWQGYRIKACLHHAEKTSLQKLEEGLPICVRPQQTAGRSVGATPRGEHTPTSPLPTPPRSLNAEISRDWLTAVTCWLWEKLWLRDFYQEI